MKYFLFTISIVVIFVIVFMYIVHDERQPSPITIGVIGTLTGVGAYQGQQEIRGLEVARDEINRRGGINGRLIELVVEDSEALPQTAVTVFEKLIFVDNVSFVIGDSWSSTTLAMVSVANEHRVLLISPLALLDALSDDDLFFRTMPNVDRMMEPLAEYAYYDLGSRRVGIMRQNTPFGVEHADSFQKYFGAFGGVVVGEEVFELTQVDVRSEIEKVVARNPDMLFNLHATGGPMAGVLMKQAKELGVDVMWLGSFGVENAPLVEEFGDVVEGLVYPYPYDSSRELESVYQFKEKYQDRYSEEPDLTAANSYDALMLLAQAIEAVGESPFDVKNYLLGMTEYEGASGMLSFDEHGDVERPITIKQIQNGGFINVSH